MEWQDEGLVIGARRHGERDAILEVMTANHGRHLGPVRGGRSQRQSPNLQPGNRVTLTWRARLEDHLGQFTAEPLESRAGQVLVDPLALHVVSYLAMLLRLMPERAPHLNVYQAADGLCRVLAHPALLGAVLIRFEVMILAELGFGLDLVECAATGACSDLVYVSPKSGRAVSRTAGLPWAERLLPLPGFLLDETLLSAAERQDVADGFRLTGYFLDRHIFDPRGMGGHVPRDLAITTLMQRLGGEAGRIAL